VFLAVLPQKYSPVCKLERKLWQALFRLRQPLQKLRPPSDFLALAVLVVAVLVVAVLAAAASRILEVAGEHCRAGCR